MSGREKKLLWCSILVIRNFIHNKCEDRPTSADKKNCETAAYPIVVKEDGHELKTDWGYFEEGLDEIEAWLLPNEKGENQ